MKVKDIKTKFPNINIKTNEPLSNYTFTKTGGPADILVFPTSVEEIAGLVDWTNENDVPLTVLGSASNLIVKDGGIRGMVMLLTDMTNTFAEKNKLIVESGVKIIDAAKAAYEAGLTGLEFSYGIPGSVGGAVYMNAGAYGGEVKDVIESVTVLTREGDIATYNHKEMNFDYRYSVIMDTQDIILSTTFSLEKGNKEEIKEKMIELMTLRKSKQPLEYPSCGSVFKRPPGHFAGKLIQDANLQGEVCGGAQVSEKHAGFIVNINHATASDYIELIQHIQTVVKEKFNIELECEVRIIGENEK